MRRRLDGFTLMVDLVEEEEQELVSLESTLSIFFDKQNNFDYF